MSVNRLVIFILALRSFDHTTYVNFLDFILILQPTPNIIVSRCPSLLHLQIRFSAERCRGGMRIAILPS